MTAGERYRTLIAAEDIQQRIEQMGQELTRRFAGQNLLAVVLLDGAVMFAADLLRCLQVPGLRTHFMRAASYHGGMQSSGKVALTDLPRCRGQSVLLIDDILDSGRTLQRVYAALHEAGAAAISTCVLLDKPGQRECAIESDYVGFTVPEAFLVGYGLDIGGRLRHLPDVCVYEPPSR
ncbi:MAG: hypoxanthine phosphoribosyltransferase [Planctomycetota bacterium]|nr:MAG: hypoxanthine phosphoribosyltransferase [Planctomycetota bacterium]